MQRLPPQLPNRQKPAYKKGDYRMNLLPIGSIVLLKDGVKKVMIYGRKQLDTETNKV